MYLLVSKFLILSSCGQCANILGVFMFPSISHQMVYQPIWRELSLRGHKVTVLTPDPLNDPSLTNLTEISIRFTYQIWENYHLEDLLSKDLNVFQNRIGIFQLFDVIAEIELNSTEFQQLIRDKEKHFDLILAEGFHPVMFAFGERFQAPVISVTSIGVPSTGHDIVGNPNHPVLYSELKNSDIGHLTFWRKVKSCVFHFWCKHYHSYVFAPRTHELAKKYFGKDVSYIGDLEKGVSMMFLNVNPLITSPRSNVPAVLGMGQMHIKPVEPLPEDLKLVLDEATEGVVFFSLGSNVKSINLEENLKNVIKQVLAELPYKVLWKWENDEFPDKPSNVIIRKWFPQQDVLAHPNVRVFVTQGGFQSMEEAISRGIPLVGMPFIADQPANVQKIVDLGIGVAVNPTTLTKGRLRSSIVEVAENSGYKRRVEEVSQLLYDKPMIGLEKAVWWAEYVIRHRGARHLRSPRVDISSADYFLLDFGLVVVVVGSLISYAGYKTVRMCVSML